MVDPKLKLKLILHSIKKANSSNDETDDDELETVEIKYRDNVQTDNTILNTLFPKTKPTNDTSSIAGYLRRLSLLVRSTPPEQQGQEMKVMSTPSQLRRGAH